MNTINLTPGRPALDATHLDALCDLYLQETARRVEPVTLAGYTYALGVFRRWWQDAGPRLGWLLTRQDLEQFGRDLEAMHSTQYDTPLTYQTRMVILSRLKQALRWAFVNDYVERDYSVWMPQASGVPRERKVLPAKAISRLMAAAGESDTPERNQAILAVLIGTGMRRAECAALDVADLQFDLKGGGEITIRRGKGGKARPVVFDDRTEDYLDAHLKEMGASTGPLWRNRYGARLGSHGVYYVVKATLRQAGYDAALAAPHDFRRMFVTYWNRGRRSLDVAAPLSKQMGHTTTAMTLQYLLTDIEDIRRSYISPFDYVESE